MGKTQHNNLSFFSSHNISSSSYRFDWSVSIRGDTFSFKEAAADCLTSAEEQVEAEGGRRGRDSPTLDFVAGETKSAHYRIL